MKAIKILLVVLLAISVAACGGGDNSTPAVTYAISGTVTGPWVEGVTITASGVAHASTTTDASGNYTLANLPAGAYTVTPSLAGYTYSPPASAVAVSANTTQDFAASSVIPSYSISGTVSYGGTKTGPVYVYVDSMVRAGTRIVLANGSGAYTIRGLPAGYYLVNAVMDTQGTGQRNRANPLGSSSYIDNTTPANLTGINITLADPTPPMPVTPTGLNVAPSSDAALITWDPPEDGDYVEIATSYKIYWGTDAAATNGNPITVPTQADGAYIQGGLQSGTSYYYRITALVGSVESTASAVVGPVAIGATTGLNTVSGTVSVNGTVTGPLLVFLSSDTGIYSTRIANPANPQAFSISGIPNGRYFIGALVDMNSNGIYDTGDIYSFNPGSAPQYVTVASDTNHDLTLTPAASPIALVTTMCFSYGQSNGCWLNLSIVEGAKHIEGVTLVSGPNVAVPLDIGNDGGFGSSLYPGKPAPAVGDRYGFKVTFSDGTSENISGSVTGVLNPATNLAVQTTAPATPTIPLFTWDAPISPPASYTYYEIGLYGAGATWHYPENFVMPSTTTSVLYNADGTASIAALTPGVTYNWYIFACDEYVNCARTYSTYTP